MSSNATDPAGGASLKSVKKRLHRWPPVDFRFHYDDHHQFETHLTDFVAAYNFGRRLKTLRGLTPYEFICKCWTSEPERFTIDPIHQMPGLNSPRQGPAPAATTEFPDVRLKYQEG